VTAVDQMPTIRQRFSTLVELLRYRSQEQPHDVAFNFLQQGEVESDRLTFQQLDLQAQTIAVHLQRLVKPGDRALLLYPSGLDFIAAFFGCLYANVIAVPAYPPRATQNLGRLQSIVEDAEAAIALTTETILSGLGDRWAADAPSIKWLATDQLHGSNLDEWISPIVTPDTLAFLQYTSGSTGKPKGVMVSHANLLHNEQQIKAAFGHNQHTVSVGWLPLFHDMGLVGNVLQPLYLGLACTMMSPVDFLQKPFRWLDAISRYRATSSGGPNFAYDLCVRKITAEQKAQLDLSLFGLRP
jgi:acyl-CoA synthetase (AMP-forming)/AMP-acid ligase II